ncbi:hypothetical protein JNUCC0626_19755 [Lentzea sp. JNUCC 0626]|uniref:hypothetical protein n=1 Tax=Lentzea sp. JNUCC 0626 TaxID=3367513 RepID=UPI0037479ED8
MTERFWVIFEQHRTEVDGFVPALITVGNPDPQMGAGDSARPRVWGRTWAEAQKMCDQANVEDYGLTHVQARDMVVAFLEADPARWETGPCSLDNCFRERCNGVVHMGAADVEWPQMQGMAMDPTVSDYTAYDWSGDGEFSDDRGTWRFREELMWRDWRWGGTDEQDRRAAFTAHVTPELVDICWEIKPDLYNDALDRAIEYALQRYSDQGAESPVFGAAFLAVFEIEMSRHWHDIDSWLIPERWEEFGVSFE